MDELAREILAGEEAWIVGGAVRDELLGRDVIDLDIACRDPQGAAREYAKRAGGAPFPLSERHGAWRVALEAGRTVDFTPLPGVIADDLATRDFTINAIALPLAGGDAADPYGGRGDIEQKVVRAVSASVFEDDPLRLLRAVRLEDELGFRMDSETERLLREHSELVTQPAGERILAELVRLSEAGYRRADELGLLAPLGGSSAGLERDELVDRPAFRLVAVFGDSLGHFPVSNELKRYARALLRAEPPGDGSLRAIYRFRRATEPWALDALVFVGAGGHAESVRAARESDPAEPLLRGDELGLPPGPEIGRLLERVEEERAAGEISTREEALELVRREQQT
jgi:tRNA nucleotidyltransferase/poly(A) polymerase